VTSPIQAIVVVCPCCSRRYEDWYRASINAQLDPGMAADTEYVRDAASAKCPDCGYRVFLDMLIVDGDLWRMPDPPAS
jgi:DNA-directed RNA polymerase subunit RPC12/RpoP